MESPVSFTGHQEAREICLRGGKSGFPDESFTYTARRDFGSGLGLCGPGLIYISICVKAKVEPTLGYPTNFGSHLSQNPAPHFTLAQFGPRTSRTSAPMHSGRHRRYAGRRHRRTRPVRRRLRPYRHRWWRLDLVTRQPVSRRPLFSLFPPPPPSFCPPSRALTCSVRAPCDHVSLPSKTHDH